MCVCVCVQFFSISELTIFIACPQPFNNCAGTHMHTSNFGKLICLLLPTVPNAVRHITPSLQPDQVVRLLWQQDGFSFPGDWYLSGLRLVTTDPGQLGENSLKPSDVMDTWLVGVCLLQEIFTPLLHTHPHTHTLTHTVPPSLLQEENAP